MQWNEIQYNEMKCNVTQFNAAMWCDTIVLGVNHALNKKHS